MGDLGSNRSAVRVAQEIVDLAQRRLPLADMERARVEHAVQIVLCETVVLEKQIGNARPLVDLDGVDVRAAMTEVPVRADERLNPHLLRRELGRLDLREAL